MEVEGGMIIECKERPMSWRTVKTSVGISLFLHIINISLITWSAKISSFSIDFISTALLEGKSSRLKNKENNQWRETNKKPHYFLLYFSALSVFYLPLSSLESFSRKMKVALFSTYLLKCFSSWKNAWLFLHLNR